MRKLPSTEPQFAGQHAAPCTDAVPAASLAHSALHLTRAAIARWRGRVCPLSPVRELPRVSPQERWVTQAQAGLDTWIACGGFAQGDLSDLAPLTPPVMHNCTSAHSADRDADACID